MKRVLPVAFAALLLLAGCAPSTDEIVAKIQEGKELSDADYTAAIEAASEVNRQLADTIEKYADDRMARGRAMIAMSTDEKLAGVDYINRVLLNTDPATLSEENRTALEKLLAEEAKTQTRFYQAMGYPEGFSGLQQLPEVPADDSAVPADSATLNPTETVM